MKYPRLPRASCPQAIVLHLDWRPLVVAWRCLRLWQRPPCLSCLWLASSCVSLSALAKTLGWPRTWDGGSLAWGTASWRAITGGSQRSKKIVMIWARWTKLNRDHSLSPFQNTCNEKNALNHLYVYHSFWRCCNCSSVQKHSSLLLNSVSLRFTHSSLNLFLVFCPFSESRSF